MSTFNLQIEYPTINYDWKKLNSNGTAKCPANWDLVNYSFEAYRYVEVNNEWVMLLYPDDKVKTPILTKNISFTISKLTFKHYCLDSVTYSINVWFNDSDYITIETAGTGEPVTTTIDVPENTEYIAFEPLDYETYLYVDLGFEFKTKEMNINIELSNFTTVNNNRFSKAIDETLIVTSLGKREIFYVNELILTPEEAEEINSIVDLAILNNFLVVVNITNYEVAGNNLGGIASAEEIPIKYYYKNHSETQKTGIYKYVNLQYKNDINNAYTI